MEEHSGIWGLANPLKLFSNTLGLAKGRLDFAKCFPDFGIQVYFKENLIHMFLIYLFFSHQIIVLKQWVNAQERPFERFNEIVVNPPCTPFQSLCPEC